MRTNEDLSQEVTDLRARCHQLLNDKELIRGELAEVLLDNKKLSEQNKIERELLVKFCKLTISIFEE